jgi:hypothetical protein
MDTVKILSVRVQSVCNPLYDNEILEAERKIHLKKIEEKTHSLYDIPVFVMKIIILFSKSWLVRKKISIELLWEN